MKLLVWWVMTIDGARPLTTVKTESGLPLHAFLKTFLGTNDRISQAITAARHLGSRDHDHSGLRPFFFMLCVLRPLGGVTFLAFLIGGHCENPGRMIDR